MKFIYYIYTTFLCYRLKSVTLKSLSVKECMEDNPASCEAGFLFIDKQLRRPCQIPDAIFENAFFSHLAPACAGIARVAGSPETGSLPPIVRPAGR